jgi:CubicO group peptidase (beta-lactamase class C family)
VAEIQGSYDDLFTAVPGVLSALLDASDAGASAAVFVDGAAVVDVWGGFADAGRTIPWQHDTIANVWSVTKTMTAMCALILADRGDLDVDAPVARYWPEFAAAGKDGVLVRHLLAHTAGLPDWDDPLTVDDLGNWPAATARLAAQPPQWEPGTAAGYHSLTQGFLVGEVVRRITGRSLGEFFAAEVAGPLGADFHIGLGIEHDGRVALSVPPPSRDEDYASSAPGATAAPTAGTRIRVRDGNSVAWRRAQIPAASGFGNARSVALLQSVLACGGAVGGVRLLSPAGCERAWQQEFHGEDRLLGRTARYGLGYGLFGSTCGWGGWGGSLVMIDPGARMAVAYVTSQMLEPEGDTRGLEVVMAAYDGLQGLRA